MTAVGAMSRGGGAAGGNRQAPGPASEPLKKFASGTGESLPRIPGYGLLEHRCAAAREERLAGLKGGENGR